MVKKPVLGIMLLDTTFPRIPGDVGHPDSYSFPVLMRTVPGATVQRAVFEADPSLLQSFVRTACELEAQGVAAITSSCGFLAPLQEKVAQAVKIPVFLSSLLQVPLAYALTGGRVGILTANAPSLTAPVLTSAGIPASLPVAIGGMQDTPAFRDPILNGEVQLNKAEVQAGVVRQVCSLLRQYPDIQSFVFECHNLAPYSQAAQAETGLPVFDILSLAEWVYSSIVKRAFQP